MRLAREIVFSHVDVLSAAGRVGQDDAVAKIICAVKPTSHIEVGCIVEGEAVYRFKIKVRRAGDACGPLKSITANRLDVQVINGKAFAYMTCRTIEPHKIDGPHDIIEVTA